MKLRELLQEKIFSIYKITNIINNKIYIGKTSNVNKRWKQHIKISVTKEKKAYQYLHKSINKYGIDNFRIEVLETNLNEFDAFEKEKFWIQNFNSNDFNIGMNLTNGGEGASGLKWSEESRDKKRGKNNHNYGKPLSDDVKEKLSLSLSGENNGFYGKKHSKEIIDFLKNREISDDIKNMISENCRGENQWNAKFSNLDILKIRKQWDNKEKSQTELAKEYGVKPNTINQIVNRKRWTHI